ncbi:histidinol-phosphate aminotransferase family protein [Methanofollis formosanus]|uniref:Histidinol-phosphate aminotransferase family protein n=1 Tax=Methanofollis formosanus TaxID=299308 RepID=A0A8G1EEZ5_9EURY|nr:histidinol-phosphate transaminase [Methanofollis formosanus]QYZ78375.1 histidinol-phosphate aminotransferase family protein [Methanofollis formosanus]
MTSHIPDKMVHGGTVRWYTKHSEIDLLDFSASINPFPPIATVTPPDEDAITSYPDDRYEELKEAIAIHFRRSPEEVTLGNGSVEVIRTFCAATLGPGMRAAIIPPTFGEYEMGVHLAGGAVTTDPGDAAVRFLCNPNNPDGTLTSRDAVLALLDDLPDGQRLFVDEAFIELADPTESVSDIRHPALFVSRSITKSFAVPGLRFGFGLGDPDLVADLEARRLPWTVNAWAEAFALRALRHIDDLAESRRLIREERARLIHELRALGLAPYPSAANYLLIPLPCPAPVLAAAMIIQGILVRDCTSFGLPDAIRVAVRRRDENRKLVEALAGCLP